MNGRLETAIAMLNERKASCVLLREGKEPYVSTAIGIKPLMVLLREDRNAFEGGVLADKVIGKAAAMMAVLGGVSELYGEVMSSAAIEYLEKQGIPYQYKELVPYITNRTHTGKCPMEEAVWNIEDAEEAFDVLECTIRRLMSQKTGE